MAMPRRAAAGRGIVAPDTAGLLANADKAARGG
jgi:hypothetical protein